MTDLKAVADQIAKALAPYGATDAETWQDGSISILFYLIGNPTGMAWRKAIKCAGQGATPQSVLHLMNEWKRDTLMSIGFGKHSDTIQYALKTYGESAVKEALKPCPLH